MTKLSGLRERADREGAIMSQELQEYQRFLDHDTNLQNFMETKARERQPQVDPNLSGKSGTQHYSDFVP